MRRALVQVHLWTGLAVGLYVLVSSVTGAVLVFQEELGHAAQAALHRASPAGPDGRATPLTLDEASTALGRALPAAHVLTLAPPQTADGTFQAGILVDGYQLAFIHPFTGEVTGPVAPGGPVVSWLHEVHANLLSGRSGRLANGVGGLLLVLLAVTGLVIWWPRAGAWRRALLLKRRVGWKRAVFDLHHVVGFWLLVPVVVLALTGTYFTWPAHFRTVIGWFSPVTPVPVPRSDLTRTVEGPATLEQALSRAREAMPGRHIVRVGLPGQPVQPYTVFVGDHAGTPHRALTRVFVDQHTGALLEVRPPGGYRSVGDAIADWIGPLHTGHFGGPIIKTIWAVVGLAPALLFLTGFLMWWNRVVAPWRRRAARSPGASTQ
jgi:uncharacterized iron-regulated membrane protein